MVRRYSELALTFHSTHTFVFIIYILYLQTFQEVQDGIKMTASEVGQGVLHVPSLYYNTRPQGVLDLLFCCAFVFCVLCFVFCVLCFCSNISTWEVKMRANARRNSEVTTHILFVFVQCHGPWTANLYGKFIRQIYYTDAIN